LSAKHVAGEFVSLWNNHHSMGSLTPSMTSCDDAFTSERYLPGEVCDPGRGLLLVA